jgi:hypothetical protein
VDVSPKTRDKDGKVNVLECPFPDVEGPSSLIVSSLFFSFSFSLSLSLSGFLRKGRASDGNRRNVDVDVDAVVVEGGVGAGAGDEVEVTTGVRFLPKGGVVISY